MSEEVLAFGPFELDPDTYELRHGGVCLELEPKIGEFLWVLARASPRTVSREEMTERLWLGVAVTDNSLHQVVSRARRAVGDDGSSQRVIRTVRGVGWRLVGSVRAYEKPETAAGPAKRRRTGAAAAELPFVGRADLLALLEQDLETVLAGGSRFTLLLGEAGAGKTRLAHELARRAARRGVRAVFGADDPRAGAPPYWGWREALAALAEPAGAASVDEPLLTAGGEGGPFRLLGSAEGTSRHRLFDDVARHLVRTSRAAPLLLVLDDLQWASEPSFLLLEFVVHEAAQGRLLVLALCREGEGLVEHPVHAVRAFFARSAGARLLEIPPLDAAETASLASLAAGAPLSPEASARVHAESRGNPFLTIRLAREASQSRRARPEFGGSVSLAVERRLRLRLRELPEPTLDLLATAAIIGEHFELDLLERASGLSSPSLVRRLEPALRAGIVAERGATGALGFHGALVPRQLLAALAREERVARHASLLRILEERGGTPPARLAVHAIASRPSTPARTVARHAAHAAREALAQGGYESAVRLAGEALRVLASERHSDPDAMRLLLEALLVRGEAQWALGHAHAAGSAFEEAVEQARDLGDAERLAKAVLGCVRLRRNPRRSDPRTVQRIEGALEAPLPPPLRARLESELASLLALESATRERAVVLSDRAIERARRSASGPALREALWGRMRIELARDVRPPAAVLETTRAVLAECAAAPGTWEAKARAARWGLWMALGRRDEADGELARLEALAASDSERSAEWLVHGLRTNCELLGACLEDAEAALVRMREHAVRDPDRTGLFLHVLLLFALCREQGRFGEVEGLVRRLATSFPQLPVLRSGLCLVLAETGRAAAATRELRRLARGGLAAWRETEGWRVGLSLLAEACLGAGDAETARSVSAALGPEEADGGRIWPTAAGLVLCGPLAYARGALALTRDDLEAADASFEAAAAEAERAGARLWSARAQLQRARTLLRRNDLNDRTEARALRRRVAALAAERQLRQLAAAEAGLDARARREAPRP